jgi:hypothetical protein
VSGLERLHEEVHQLAYRYHWPEAEILGLTQTKRHRYLALVARELEREAESRR